MSSTILARFSASDANASIFPNAGELVDMGVEKSVLRRSGTWLSYGDVRLGQGRERAREFLRDNPTVQEELRQDVLRAYGVVPAGAEQSTPEQATPGQPIPGQPIPGRPIPGQKGPEQKGPEQKGPEKTNADGGGKPNPALRRGTAPATRQTNAKGGRRN